MMNCVCLEHYWCPSANASNLKCKWAVTTEQGERPACFKDTLITVAMLVGSECQSLSSTVCGDGAEAAVAHAEQHLLPPFLRNHPDKTQDRYLHFELTRRAGIPARISYQWLWHWRANGDSTAISQPRELGIIVFFRVIELSSTSADLHHHASAKLIRTCGGNVLLYPLIISVLCRSQGKVKLGCSFCRSEGNWIVAFPEHLSPQKTCKIVFILTKITVLL